MDLERSNVLLICFAESKENLTLRFYFRELLAGSEMVREKKKKAANVMILSPKATIYGLMVIYPMKTFFTVNLFLCDEE